MIISASGNPYSIGKLETGHYQYHGRVYQFAFVPDVLRGADHIMTYADDKMIPEDEPCCWFDTDQALWVYVLYPDVQPVLPEWLADYEQMRMNVTRQDCIPDTLKGYFGLYRKRFAPGRVTLYGNSPKGMLTDAWYVDSFGSGYCMYSACIVPTKE